MQPFQIVFAEFLHMFCALMRIPIKNYLIDYLKGNNNENDKTIPNSH